jgi:hypothetical protein
MGGGGEGDDEPGEAAPRGDPPTPTVGFGAGEEEEEEEVRIRPSEEIDSPHRGQVEIKVRLDRD